MLALQFDVAALPIKLPRRDEHLVRGIRVQFILKWSAETLPSDFHHVAVVKFDACTEAERRRAEKVNVRLARLAMLGVLEMVIL